jgi:hypothetical protein
MIVNEHRNERWYSDVINDNYNMLIDDIDSIDDNNAITNDGSWW